MTVFTLLEQGLSLAIFFSPSSTAILCYIWDIEYDFMKVNPPNKPYIGPCVHVFMLTQLCLTLWDLMDCSTPGSSVHWIFPARISEWAVISFSTGSSQTRDRNCISCIGRQILYLLATEGADIGPSITLIQIYF